jgi:hypothetical protein
MKMKRILRMLVAAILVSAIALPLLVMPAFAVTGATVTFEPSASHVDCFCETTDVAIYVTSDINLGAGALQFEYTYCCANVTAYTPNPDNTVWDYNVAILKPGWVGIAVSSPAGGAGAGKILIGTVTIHCCDDGSDCQTALDWIDTASYFEDVDEMEVPTSLMNGSFTCGPCGPPPEMILESVAKIPDGDLTVTPGYPPGFEPRDEFEPCEWVYVWGHGFEFCQCYEIYIQPYVECKSVVEGQKLDHSLSADLGYPAPGCDPIVVHVKEDGTFGPIPLFHATEDMICSYWEIVADKVPGPCEDIPPIGCAGIGSATNPGVYMANEDGLDAVCCDVYGFHIVPEALSLILLSTGLIGLGGYYRLRRRKKTISDE